MSKIDLIIDALNELMYSNSTVVAADKYLAALNAANELKALKPVGKFVKAIHGNYPTMSWKEGYVAKIGDKFYALDEVTK
jgi:hypothetical protein